MSLAGLHGRVSHVGRVLLLGLKGTSANSVLPVATHLRTKCCWLPWMASSSSRSYASGMTASWYRCCRTAGQRRQTTPSAGAGLHEERQLRMLLLAARTELQFGLLLLNTEQGLGSLHTVGSIKS